MSPRRYVMNRRNSSVAETKQRILEATLKLHTSKGIFGTSWQDIAREADVALGTVYKHFPSLEQLVPACGELLMQRIQPPSPDDAEEIIGDAVEPAERLHRVIAALFDFYERGGAHLETDIRERQLPAMQEWERHQREMVTHFVSKALRDWALSADEIQMASALLDFPTYQAMRARDISTDQAVQQVGNMIMCRPGARHAGGRQSKDLHRVKRR